MEIERIGEILTISGAFVVAVSLIGVLTELALPFEAQHIAWGGVGLIVVGEAILVKG